MTEFKTKENLKKATSQELAKAAGVNADTAEELYRVIQDM